ncbi:MAG TPA: ABC transporter substrate-binding protein [Pyrinomonadaceae bacterium]
MKKLIILVTLVIAVLPAACSRQPKRIAIGIALTVSYHPAVKLAIKEINARGGIGGVPVELRGMDWIVTSQFEAQEILKHASEFSEDKDLIAVIGHSDSASTLSAAAFYNQQRIPQIVTIATNPAITNIGTWTYRLCLSDAAQGPALAEYAVNDWHKRRVAVFYVNDDYGRGVAELFEKRVDELGGQIVSSVMHRNLLTDDDRELIRATLAGFKQGQEPDLIVLFQRLDAAKWTLGTIRDLKLKSSILGGDSLSPADFSAAHPELTEGMRVSQFFVPDLNDLRTRQFLKDFQELAGRAPDYGNAFAYDAVYLVCEAAAKGGATRAGVKAYLDKLIQDQIPGHGVVGTFVMGSNHDAKRALHIVETRNGVQTFLKTLQIN